MSLSVVEPAPELVPLPSPAQARTTTPLLAREARVVAAGRDRVGAVLEGRDDRLLVVAGPCSVHDVDTTREYAGRLAALARERADDVVVVMRSYVEKPRTRLGWRGLLNDPDLDGEERVARGIVLARRAMLGVLGTGLPVATELVDPHLAPYVTDLTSWASIGARTVQSQPHRLLASGLPLPVGFKNPTSGSIGDAVDAICTAGSSHHCPTVDDDGRLALQSTAGNRHGHLVLRGGADGANCDPMSVLRARDRLRDAGLDPVVVVDASHGNSGKCHLRQAEVVDDLADRLGRGERGVVGVMMESFLGAGRQDLPGEGSPAGLRHGVSITDACLGWETTRLLVGRLADAVRARRALDRADQTSDWRATGSG